MKIIDKYILKKYLITFLFTLLILIPITVAIDVAEKVDKFLRNENLTFNEILNDYYINFIIYFGNTFMPLSLFISVMLFTSKMANNSEIIAINSSQISLKRFLYPYFIGATVITIFALYMNHFVVPTSNKIRLKFEDKYLKKKKYEDNSIRNFSLQLNDSTYIFIQNFDLNTNTGYDFSIETYNNIKLKSKLISDNISWNKKDSVFTLLNWQKRIIFDKNDSISYGDKIDTIFIFSPKDFNYQSILSQEIASIELSKFIKISKQRGVKNLNAYLVELYKRTSLPLASYILTLIAVILSYKKKRGGIGVSLSIGVFLMFVYVFFMKVGEVLGAVSGANSLLYVWLPNLFFGTIAIYLFLNERE